MAIVFRTAGVWGAGIGANLTPVQVDNNFYETLTRIIALETTPPEAVSIDTIAVVGDQITFTMTDATTRGPFTIPSSMWNDAGEWLPLTVYLTNDIIHQIGSLYRVLHNHTSEAVFDPAAEDIDGFFYSLLLSQPIQPNDLHVFIGGPMSDNQLILRTVATRRWQLPIGLTGSFFESGIAAIAEKVVTLYKGITEIGTLTWAAAGTVPTVVFASQITFEIGDKFFVRGPNVADVGLADISFDILGYRL